VPSRLLDIRDLVFAVLTGVAGAVLAPSLPFVGVPLAAASLGWIAMRHGYIPSLIAAVLAAGIGTALAGDWVAAVFVAPAMVVAGPGTAWALSRWSVVRVIAGLTVVLLVSAIALDAAVAASQGTDLVSARATEATAMRELVLQSVAKSGNADAKTAEQVADQFASAWLQLWPTLYLYMTGLAALIAVPAVSRIGRALGKPVSASPPLQELDMSPHVVWPTIAGLALLAGAAYLSQPNGWMQVIGANLLLAVRPVLFFQGLGGFAALYRKADVSRIARGFGYALLVFTETIVPSVSVLGLVDLFANLRKLPRQGSGVSAGAARA
jgi:uncharacterized protein YybS (DUF2232 family)